MPSPLGRCHCVQENSTRIVGEQLFRARSIAVAKSLVVWMVVLFTLAMIAPWRRQRQLRSVLCAMVPGWHEWRTTVFSYSSCCLTISPSVVCLPLRGSVSIVPLSCIQVVNSIWRSSWEMSLIGGQV